jgi:hypothetical protein
MYFYNKSNKDQETYENFEKDVKKIRNAIYQN